MPGEAFEVTVGDDGRGDFLFTWKPQHWDYEELRKLVEIFRSRGAAEEPWTCSATRKIKPGDRAYLLKQGKPIGLFGRGTVIRKPGGASPRHALLRFDVTNGGVLWDPTEEFLVDESTLLALPVPKKQWQNQSAGITLNNNAARAIDRLILDAVLIGRSQAVPIDDTAQEVAARLKRLLAMRPHQRLFSEGVREKYRNKCAVTGCLTPAALEAAHINTHKGEDDNSLANGILLRSDIHGLFDRFLITLSEDGTKIETSPELTDPGYAALKTATVTRPVGGPAPSAKNIREHRRRFFERLGRRGNQG
jgi:hypothetical protein